MSILSGMVLRSPRLIIYIKFIIVNFEYMYAFKSATLATSASETQGPPSVTHTKRSEKIVRTRFPNY